MRREIITVRGQSYVSRLPKYWPPPTPLSARRLCTPAFVWGGGGHTRRAEMGVGGQYFGRRETQDCPLTVIISLSLSLSLSLLHTLSSLPVAIVRLSNLTTHLRIWKHISPNGIYYILSFFAQNTMPYKPEKNLGTGCIRRKEDRWNNFQTPNTCLSMKRFYILVNTYITKLLYQKFRIKLNMRGKAQTYGDSQIGMGTIAHLEHPRLFM